MSIDHPILPFQDNASGALSYLLRQPDNHTAALEAVYRQQAKAVKTLPQGVLLKDTKTNTLLLSAESKVALTLLLHHAPCDASAVVLHRSEWQEQVAEKYPGWKAEVCSLWYCPQRELPRFAVPFEVWPLDPGDVEEALRGDGTLPVPLFRQQIEDRQVFGACIDDRLAGTVGIDPTGAVNWLSVLPPWRGRGIGLTLLRWMLKRELENGHVPFVLLPQSKAAAMPLLKKAGLRQAEQDVICFKGSTA